MNEEIKNQVRAENARFFRGGVEVETLQLLEWFREEKAATEREEKQGGANLEMLVYQTSAALWRLWKGFNHLEVRGAHGELLGAWGYSKHWTGNVFRYFSKEEMDALEKEMRAFQSKHKALLEDEQRKYKDPFLRYAKKVDD